MAIRVEFFGIARQRVGRAAIELEAQTLTLGQVWTLLRQEAPGFDACLAQDQLHPTLAANLDGRQFVSDRATVIRDGQSLLILSADAGG